MSPRQKSRSRQKSRKAGTDPEGDFTRLVERFKQVLGERVTDVRRQQPSLAVRCPPGGCRRVPQPELQRVYKYLGKEYEVPKKILELNPS